MQVCLHGFKFGFLLEEAGTVSAKGKAFRLFVREAFSVSGLPVYAFAGVFER